MWSSSDDALLNMYGHVRPFRNPILLDVVKLRQGSGKDGQGMAVKMKGLKAYTIA